jgi:hypothetical protein
LKNIKLLQILDKNNFLNEAFKSRKGILADNILLLVGLELLKWCTIFGLELIKLLFDLAELILDSNIDFNRILLNEQELVNKMLRIIFKLHPKVFQVIQVVIFYLTHQPFVAWFELALDVSTDFLKDSNVIILLAFNHTIPNHIEIRILHFIF